MYFYINDILQFGDGNPIYHMMQIRKYPTYVSMFTKVIFQNTHTTKYYMVTPCICIVNIIWSLPVPVLLILYGHSLYLYC